MENSNFTDEQIDDYLMGRSDGKAKTAFEEALLTDQDLKLRFEERKELIHGIEEYHGQLFKEKLKKIHKNNFTTPTKTVAKKRSLVPWLAAAATIALLVVALFWLNKSPLSTDELYAANFEIFELNISQRNSSDRQEYQLEELYHRKQYAEAIPIFESLIAGGNKSIQLQLGAGIAKMETNQIEAALVHFSTILASGDLLYKDHAQWYSALAHLKAGDKEQAKSFLQSLANDETADHHQEAVKLLKDLK